MLKINKFIKQLSAFRFNIKERMNVMAAVKGGRALIRLVRLVLPVIGLCTTRSRVRAIVVFLRHLSTLYSHNGAKGACLILKVYAVTLQQALGGYRVHDISELKFRVSRNRAGLPRVIPSVHREMIRNEDFKMAQFYLTLFNLYRVIEFKGDMRFSSLSKSIVSPAKTGPGFAWLSADLLAFIPLFYRSLVRLTRLNVRSLYRQLMEEYQGARPFPLLKSSPFTFSAHKLEGLTGPEQQEAMAKLPVVSTHPAGLMVAANALATSEVSPDFEFFLGLLPEDSTIRHLYRISASVKLDPMKVTIPLFTRQPSLGKLSLKEEAAGKVRVFAMVDPFTQWVLRPLHLFLFEILKSIPQDGTMNQLAPVKALLARDPSGLFSLDLSAATDRLPLWLQKALLGGLTGSEFALHWANLLVNRDYTLTLTSRTTELPVYRKLRYAVGQPMGAYSSWAMLAFVHHFIVQYCAYRSGVTKAGQWFTDYAIVGDDLVIGNASVAKVYLSVMRTLGVGIGLHKSLISSAGSALEFAKRTFWKGHDVSPVPFTELQAAFSMPAAAVEFIKKYNLTLAAFLKAAGYGYRVLGSLHRPIGKLNGKVRLIILSMNIPVEVDDIQAFFAIGSPKRAKAFFECKEVIDALVSREFVLMKRALNKIQFTAYSLEGSVLRARDISAKIASWMTIGSPDLIVRTRQVLPIVKDLQYYVQGIASEVIKVTAQQISAHIIDIMLHRHDKEAVEVYTSMISLQKMMANLPLSAVKYSRVLDTENRQFNDGVHIRLWKALSGIVQGTSSPVSNKYGFGMRI